MAGSCRLIFLVGGKWSVRPSELEKSAAKGVAGVLNDTIQTVPSVVDDDVNAAKVPVNLFEEHFSALDRVSDIIFGDEEFVRGVSCCELGDTGCFSCDSGHTFTSRNHLLD